MPADCVITYSLSPVATWVTFTQSAYPLPHLMTVNVEFFDVDATLDKKTYSFTYTVQSQDGKVSFS